MPDPAQTRLSQARRVVVLVRPGSHPRPELLARLARAAAALVGEREPVLIAETGAGPDPGGPDPAGGAGVGLDIPGGQAAAALARSAAARVFLEALEGLGQGAAQVCFALSDLASRERHLHIRNTLFGLLRARAWPLIFLNETTSAQGLGGGGGAELAAFLAPALEAGLLLVLEAGGSPAAAPGPWDKAAQAGVAVWVRPLGEREGAEEILSGRAGGDYYEPQKTPFDPARWEALTLASPGGARGGPGLRGPARPRARPPGPGASPSGPGPLRARGPGQPPGPGGPGLGRGPEQLLLGRSGAVGGP